MSSKKIVHEIDADELIKLATGSSEPVVMDKLSPSAKFIYELGIKHGDEKIPAQLVYFTYREWNGWENKRQPRPQFFRDFSKFFNSIRTSNGVCYLLNPKPFDLSDEAYWIMRKSIRDEKISSEKTKKAKKPTR